MNALMSRWSLLAPREKMGVSIATIAVVLTVLILFVVGPALRGIRDTSQRLPVLAAQKAQVEMLAGNVGKVVQPTTPNREALTQSAASLNVPVEVTGDGPFTLKFTGASFSAVMQFVAQAQRSFGLNVRDAKFERQPVGTVSGQLVLSK
jgi:general secretion pathway protein M